MFYKQIKNGTIALIGESPIVPYQAVQITEEKYNQLMAVIRNHPSDTLETKHYLSAETETYVGRETTHEEKVDWYVSAVLTEQMTINGVPSEYQEEVKAKLPQEEQEKYTLDEAANILAQEVNA